MPDNNQGSTKLVLENELVSITLDRATGALLALLNKETDWSIQGRTFLGRSFELVVPLPERLLNRVIGTYQNPASMETSPDENRIILNWDQVSSEYGGTLNISVKLTITLDGPALKFDMQIDNQSPYVVESAAYPMIGDLTRPEKGNSLQSMALSHTTMRTKSLYPAFPNERGYWGTEFPIQMDPTPISPFLLVMSEEEGLYVGCHDTTAEERVEFTFQLKPGYGKVGYVPAETKINGQQVHIEFTALHLPFVQPGEHRNLAPIVIQPFVGDWHRGADIYQSWRSTWMKSPYIPSWLNEVHAWQQLQMTTWGDTLSIAYKDLIEYGKACTEHGIGAIQLTGWTFYGQDGRLPIHDIDPRLGTWDELKGAITRIQEMGVKVVLYEKYTCVDQSIDWYTNELHKFTSKDVFGHTHGHEGWQYDTPAHLAGINTRPYAWMCMTASDWHEIALAQVQQSLRLEPDGILLDECQWHGRNAFYCFDESHGHRTPAYNFGGDALFETKLRHVLDEEDPDLVLAGEAPYDLQNRHYNLTYNRGSGPPGLRYIDPFRPIMYWVRGYDDRENINICLLYRYLISYEPRHFRGRIDEFPLTLEYGKKVDSLRRRYGDYLWNAEFRDTIGATVTVQDQPHLLYTVFHQKDAAGRAVVVANHTDEMIDVHIELDDTPENLSVVSPEMPERQPFEGHVQVLARSVIVVLVG